MKIRAGFFYVLHFGFILVKLKLIHTLFSAKTIYSIKFMLIGIA